MSTVFSRIFAGEIPAAIVHEDALCVAFMDAGQVNPGHVLVASRREVATFTDLTEDEAAHIFRIAHRIARAVQKAFPAPGMTLLQANNPEGWQTVPHFHVHVLPRFADDGADLTWPRPDPGLEALREYGEKVRAALGT
ncbi:MAG: HIT family protein [Rhodospirillaceae bacterium]